MHVCRQYEPASAGGTCEQQVRQSTDLVQALILRAEAQMELVQVILRKADGPQLLPLGLSGSCPWAQEAVLPLASEDAPPLSGADARFLHSAVAALSAYRVGQLRDCMVVVS